MISLVLLPFLGCSSRSLSRKAFQLALGELRHWVRPPNGVYGRL
jgi:hypothetical protein